MIETYDLPQVPPTPSEADVLLDNLHNVFIRDPEHPYNSRIPSVRERWVNRLSEIHEISAKGKRVNPFDQAVEEKKQRDIEAQQKIDSDYKVEAENLKSLGGDASQYFHPGETHAYHVTALKQAALLHNGEFGELASSLRDSFRKIQPNAEIRVLLNKFEGLAVGNAPATVCNSIGGALIDYCVDRHEELKK